MDSLPDRKPELAPVHSEQISDRRARKALKAFLERETQFLTQETAHELQKILEFLRQRRHKQ